MNTATYQKKITSHTGHARFLAECSEEPVGEVPSSLLPRTPYAYSQTKLVWQHGNERVAIVETSHKTYEVWKIEGDLLPVEAA